MDCQKAAGSWLQKLGVLWFLLEYLTAFYTEFVVVASAADLRSMLGALLVFWSARIATGDLSWPLRLGGRTYIGQILLLSPTLAWSWKDGSVVKRLLTALPKDLRVDY